MIKLKKRKDVVIPYDDGEESFSITWRFPHATESTMTTVRKQIQAMGKQDVDSTMATDMILEQSMIAVDGFLDEDTGEALVLDDNPEKGITGYRKEIYSFVKTKLDYWTTVVLAWQNIKPKNLSVGQTQPSSGDGHLTPAQNVPTNAEVPVQDVQTKESPSGN